MARQIIDNNLDDNSAVSHNNNYEELYAGVNTGLNAKKILDEFLKGSGVVSNIMLADGSISAIKISEGAVITSRLGDGAVTTIKIDDGAVTPEKLIGYGITNNRIAAAAVDARVIADRNVYRRHILQGAVGTNELGDGAVEEKNIGPGAVNHEKLSVDSIMMNKGKDFPLSSVQLEEQVPVNISTVVKDAILDAKIFGAESDKYYRLTFIANGHVSADVQRFGVSIEERFRNTGAVSKIIFSYNDETDPGNYLNARYKKGPNSIDKITVKNGKYVAIITVDRSVISVSSSPTFLNLNSGIGRSPSAIIDTVNYSYTSIIENSLTINRGKDYPLKSVKLEDRLAEPIQDIVQEAVLDAKVFGALIGKYYRLSFIANGYLSNGKIRYGISVEERNISDGAFVRFIFVYNDDARAGNEQNANLQQLSSGIDTIMVDNGEIAMSVTVDRSKIASSETPEFLNLSAGPGLSRTAIIDPSNYSF